MCKLVLDIFCCQRIFRALHRREFSYWLPITDVCQFGQKERNSPAPHIIKQMKVVPGKPGINLLTNSSSFPREYGRIGNNSQSPLDLWPRRMKFIFRFDLPTTAHKGRVHVPPSLASVGKWPATTTVTAAASSSSPLSHRHVTRWQNKEFPPAWLPGCLAACLAWTEQNNNKQIDCLSILIIASSGQLSSALELMFPSSDGSAASSSSSSSACLVN